MGSRRFPKRISPTNDHHSLLADFLGHASWLTYCPNNLPFLSTFSDGGYHNDTWVNFRQEWGNGIFWYPISMALKDITRMPQLGGIIGKCNYLLLPHFQVSNQFRGNAVDGLFSWESAWPIRPIILRQLVKTIQGM